MEDKQQTTAHQHFGNAHKVKVFYFEHNVQILIGPE